MSSLVSARKAATWFVLAGHVPRCLGVMLPNERVSGCVFTDSVHVDLWRCARACPVVCVCERVCGVCVTHARMPSVFARVCV